MWIFILALSFLPAPALSLFFGFRAVIHAARVKKIHWLGLAAIVLTLTGKFWVRLLRKAGTDEPKVLTPHRRGTAIGVGGVKLDWEEFGQKDAPTLLLTHGLSLTQDVFFYQKKQLSKEFRVIVWDMRGAGKSEFPKNADFRIETLTDDLAAIFDATNAGKNGCILIGHSLGAMLLPIFARRHREKMTRVAGIAMLGGTDRPVLETMRGRTWLTALRHRFWEPLAEFIHRAPKFWEFLARLQHQTGMIHLATMLGLCAGNETRGQCDLIAEKCGQFSMRAAAGGGRAGFSYDARADLPKIDVPVLVLSGVNDWNAPPDIQRALACACPQSELILLPNCGHLSLLECADAVNFYVSRFAHGCLARVKEGNEPCCNG